MNRLDVPLRRRDLATTAAGATALAVAAPVLGSSPGAAAAAAPVAAVASERLRLRPDPALGAGPVVAALDVALDPASGSARRTGWVRSAALDTTTFALLGVTWRTGTGRVRARVRRVGGGWSGWQDLPMLHDLPDRGTDEGAGTPHATEPVWVGDCDGVQVEVLGSADRPVLTLVDPGTTASDAREPLARPRRRKSLRPHVRSRASWGANPAWTSGKPKQVKTVEQVHVHHTATGNSYRRRDVPRILRGIYRYHTQTLGWSDVGYNFFVDRFGRIWAGRRRPNRETRGAHTLGFNHTSVGIAVLGNFDERSPKPRILAAVAKVAAWKLHRYRRDPEAMVRVKSRGSDNYPKGERVVLPVIDGHRDTNDTACPGQYLYAALPSIRRRAKRRIRAPR